MATKKAGTTPAKKSAAKTAAATDTPTSAAKKTAAKKTPAKAAAAEAQASEKKRATHAEIAKLAHKYWEQRGGRHGSHDADWLRAEKELNS